jgi:hypothetical protein
VTGRSRLDDRPVRQSRPTDHVFRLEKVRGPSWWAKCRLANGTQVKKKIGPAWTGRGRPPSGYYTKRLAEDWLRDRIDEIRWGATPESPPGAGAAAGRGRPAAAAAPTCATFADSAADVRYAEHDRGCKPSTIRGYRNTIQIHLLPAFGELAIEDITVRDIERWRAGMSSVRSTRELLRDGTEPFHHDRDRLAFARHLIDLGCQPPPDDPKAPAAREK